MFKKAYTVMKQHLCLGLGEMRKLGFNHFSIVIQKSIINRIIKSEYICYSNQYN